MATETGNQAKIQTGIATQPDRAVAPRINVEQLLALPDGEMRNNFIKALLEAEVARQNFAYDQSMARQFALSGQFNDLKNLSPEQAVATAMVKIQLGRAWGFNAADSLKYIFFVRGQPSIENEMVATKLQQAGIFWDVEWLKETVQHKGKPWEKTVGCRLWPKTFSAEDKQFHPMVGKDGKPVSVEFTEADADHAEVWDKDKIILLSQKPSYKSWAADMYYWRCISRLKKYHAPHVLRGALRIEEALEIIPTEAVSLDPTEFQPPVAVEPPVADIKEVLQDKLRKRKAAREAEPEKEENDVE